MRRRVVSGIILTLVLMGTSTLLYNIQIVEAKQKMGYTNYGPFVFSENRDSPFKTVIEPFSASDVDIIHPEPGQFSNYSLTYYYPNGTAQWLGWWNTSYISYVQPHVINTTHTIGQPDMDETSWCTVDTTNRWVTDTSPSLESMNQTWYLMWIESDVTLGSVINWFTTNATIIGSKILNVAGQVVDTWIARSFSLDPEAYYQLYYDKQSGLLVEYEIFVGYVALRHTLTATNILVGGPLSTALYSRLEPNPAGIRDTLILDGILVNEFFQPLTNEPVMLYARSLAESWQYITSVTTNTYGIFMWQATVPGTVTPGIYIIAVYYQGSEMYESTYSLEILIIQ